MAFERSLTSACLKLVEQIKQLKLLREAKEGQLSELIIKQQTLKLQHKKCEQDTEAMITPSPCNREESEASAFKALLRRSWRLKQAIDKCHTSVQRLELQISRLEKRIEAALIMKADVMKVLKKGEGNQKLQSGIDLMLTKNQLLLGQYD